jgi:hypothetical protein
MSIVASRPKRGLAPDKALECWSDPALYQELVALVGSSDLPCTELCGNEIQDRERAQQYQKQREVLEVAFRSKLQDGELLASAIAEYADSREIIHPSLWDLLQVDYQFEECVGDGRALKMPEFFERTAIPLNVKQIPDWLDDELAAQGLNVFRHDRDYRHVVLRGMEFSLSPIHAKVVKSLHQAWLSGEPWQRGDTILEAAGSAQIKMVDAFKSRADWKILIESDGKGMYRLRIDTPLGENSTR